MTHDDSQQKGGLRLFFRNKKYIVLLIIIILLFIKFLLLSYTYSSTQTLLVVLGGGLTAKGDVPHHTQLRLDKAIHLYNLDKKNCMIITLSGGTPHKPNPLDTKGFPISESSAAARYLINKGIESNKIIEEGFSLDTIGNAYFLKTNHIDPMGIKNVIVITNKWHMSRTKEIFNDILNLPYIKAFSLLSLLDNNINIRYEEVSDGLEATILDLRIKREIRSLKNYMKDTKPKLVDMKSLHEFLFIEHTAYSSSRYVIDMKEMDTNLLKTY